MPSDGFLQQLRATFVVEAREHLQTLSDGLLGLETAVEPHRRETLIESVFRAAHSLKGAASAVELGEIEGVCQLLEDVLARQRRERAVLSAAALDVLHRALDAIGSLLMALGGEAPAPTPAALAAVHKDLRRLSVAAVTGRPTQGAAGAPADAPLVPVRDTALLAPPHAAWAATPEPPTPAPPAAPSAPAGPSPGDAAPGRPRGAVDASGTVRVALSKLEAHLHHTEELLAAKLAAGQRVAELDELVLRVAAWRTAWAAVEAETLALQRLGQGSTKRIAAGETAPAFAHLIECCEQGAAASRALDDQLASAGRAARRDREFLARSVDRALDGSKQLLLLPFSTVAATLPKLVRDLCRADGKEAELFISGGHVELDKRILEEMKDPLVHLLRNAVGHGVESPSLRAQRGKPRRAVIELAVSQAEDNRVQIVLSDDGAGISTDRVRRAAVERGLLSDDEALHLDEAAAQALVFRSALSTDADVGALSGRGLGLAIVQEHAQRLGGEVRVESTAGRGTRFCIIVPAVRATFRGILCVAAGRQFLMPVAPVERVVGVPRAAVRSVEGRETANVGGRALALVQLADVLELPAPAGYLAATALQVIVLGSGEQRMGVVVDAIQGEQEVLVKPLRKPLLRVRNIAAAAVLGSGAVVPILNAGDLLRSARRVSTRARAAADPSAPARAAGKSILVAEDSITSRLLLKSVLQSAGYAVQTAADGAEALALLRSARFDLLVTDVEMPRLNGFDLTARIRADAKLAELPVVLVTALATREDKERGIDVGANAYIVKGSFDRDNLLDAVERLI